MELDRLAEESEGMAGIVLRVDQDPSSLNAVERARYLSYEHIFYDSWEAALEA